MSANRIFMGIFVAIAATAFSGCSDSKTPATEQAEADVEQGGKEAVARWAGHVGEGAGMWVGMLARRAVRVAPRRRGCGAAPRTNGKGLCWRDSQLVLTTLQA